MNRVCKLSEQCKVLCRHAPLRATAEVENAHEREAARS